MRLRIGNHNLEGVKYLLVEQGKDEDFLIKRTYSSFTDLPPISEISDNQALYPIESLNRFEIVRD